LFTSADIFPICRVFHIKDHIPANDKLVRGFL
jgi:hypothetical protein